MLEQYFTVFVNSVPWRFAATMPQNPHEYTVRRGLSDEKFKEAVSYIREHGYFKEFRGWRYRCYSVGGWEYWTMGNPIEQTKIINRAKC